MATQEYIDDLIIVIETAEDAESVTNQMVAAVLGFLNEHLKLVSQGKEIEAEEAARIAADAALQKAIDAVSLRIDRLVGNTLRRQSTTLTKFLLFWTGLKTVIRWPHCWPISTPVSAAKTVHRVKTVPFGES